MFRRQSALDAGSYRTELTCSQDYDFFWRLSERGEAGNLGEALYHYRFSGGSVSAHKAEGQALAHQAATLLARARKQGRPENVAQALSQARHIMDREGGRYRAELKQADHLMLAGDYTRAWKAYRDLLAGHPGSPLAWGKLARLGIFCVVPAAREACFR
jgi:predicted Zn-dependent protease